MKKQPKKSEGPRLVLADGRDGLRQHRTDYWYHNRLHKPSPYGRGFPKSEDGSIEGVAKLVMKGWITKGACFDRVKGKYLWTVERGPRIEGTPLYQPIISKGEA
jgi:hypothetical protein